MAVKKSRNISDSTLHRAKKLHAMHHCAEWKLKMLQKTPRCASLRRVMTPCYATLHVVVTMHYASLRRVDFNGVQMFDIYINPLTAKWSKSATPLGKNSISINRGPIFDKFILICSFGPCLLVVKMPRAYLLPLIVAAYPNVTVHVHHVPRLSSAAAVMADSLTWSSTSTAKVWA
jgi:hypothetical protein